MGETDVGQMLTAGVGLEAVGECLHLVVGEGQRLVWRTRTPHVYVHTHTYAGLGLEDNSPFQDAAQAGSPSLLGREGKPPEYLTPTSPS